MQPKPNEIDALPPVRWTEMMPAWLLSLAIHLMLAVCGSLVVGALNRPQARDEVVRPAEIVLVRRDAGQAEYFADNETVQRHEVLRPLASHASSASDPSGSSTAVDQPPLVEGIALPQLPGGFPAGEGVVAAPQIGGARGRARIPGSALDEAAILAEDALIPREKVPTGPTAQLSLFGSAKAEGRSFVFAIDHSNSMGGAGLGAIQAAAKELAARIDQLSAEQTFQVVAYNQTVAYLTERELISATTENKRQLVSFVANLAAFGQTEHHRALLAALRLKPEVIFLLTDGGEPPLDPGQLRTIREAANGRISIHCIHFGRGPQTDTDNFLARLAAENRGSYVYVDMNRR